MYITADYLDVGPLCHDLEEDIMTSPQTERLQTKKEVHAPSLKCAAAHMDKPNAFWAKIYGQMKQRLRFVDFAWNWSNIQSELRQLLVDGYQKYLVEVELVEEHLTISVDTSKVLTLSGLK